MPPSELGRRLRRYRTAPERDWTQAHLAEAVRAHARGRFGLALGTDAKLVSDWETGRRGIGPESTMALTSLLTTNPTSSTDYDQVELSRLGLNEGPGEDAVRGSAVLLADVVALEVDPLTVDDIEERVDVLATGYFRTDPTAFRLTVLQLRARVVDLLAVRSSLRQRRRLYAALAALTGMLAESSFALGAPTDVHCAAAIALAEEAGHAALAGWVRGTQAQIALHTGSPAAAARYARAGQSAPRGSTAAVRSAAYLARASARLGDRAAARAAWSSAQRAWGDLDVALTDSVFSLSADYLPYCELTMLAWLGEAAPAARLVEGDHVSSLPTVGRAIGLIDVALVRVLDGEVEEAVRLGHRALVIGEQRMTTPLQDRFGDLVAALSPYDVAGVHELRERCVWISG